MPSLILVVGFVCTFSLVWFGSFGVSGNLSLSSHMLFLCIFVFREESGNIINFYEFPGEIVYASGGFEPHGFCWKTCCCMKVSYGLLNTWDFINFICGFWCVFCHECFYMVYCSFTC